MRIEELTIEGLPARRYRVKVQADSRNGRTRWTTCTHYRVDFGNTLGSITAHTKRDATEVTRLVKRALRHPVDGGDLLGALHTNARRGFSIDCAPLISRLFGDDCRVIVRDYQKPGRSGPAIYATTPRAIEASENEDPERARMLRWGASVVTGEYADDWATQHALRGDVWDFLPDAEQLRSL